MKIRILAMVKTHKGFSALGFEGLAHWGFAKTSTEVWTNRNMVNEAIVGETLNLKPLILNTYVCY